MPIDHLLLKSTELWLECAATFTPPGRTYTEAEQVANAAEFVEARRTMQREAPRPGASDEEREQCYRRIADAFVRFARTGLGLEDRHAALLLETGFAQIAPALDKQARAFHPAVSDSEIMQACRNAWTACGLQCLFERPMRLTPSVFAYSMLYPFSDNVMDGEAFDVQAKRRFSGRFRQRLAGVPVPAAGPEEEIVWRLVGLIESEYGRAEYPQVFESLLDIHAAQEQSLELFEECANPLPLVFAKGGASVLADGYLAAGTLTEAQAMFAFAWGVLLQLGDDLQDVAEDRAGRCTTLFTAAAAQGPLDAVTNQAFHFTRAVMPLMDAVTPSQRTLKELIERSTFALFIRAALKHRALYTPAYIEGLIPYSPEC